MLSPQKPIVSESRRVWPLGDEPVWRAEATVEWNLHNTLLNAFPSLFYGYLREEVRIWGCERAYARSHPQMRGLTTAIPREPVLLLAARLELMYISETEERFITIGRSNQRKLLLVSHTERNDRIRIISARVLTQAERKDYEEAR